MALDRAEMAKARRLQDKGPNKYVHVGAEAFAALPPAQQRVAIARDVLEWLRLGRIRPEKGTYFILLSGEKYIRGATEVNGYTCRVCALGGIFAAATEVTNLTPRGVEEDEDPWDEAARKALKPYFSEEQLRLIESAFEAADFSGPLAYGGETRRAIALGQSVDKAMPTAVPLVQWNDDGTQSTPYQEWLRERDARRMRLIMQNIIDNDGTFIP